MELAWFYLPDETLAYVAEQIDKLPIPESPQFELESQSRHLRFNTQKSFNNFYEIVFKYFLSLNNSLKDFQKVRWEARAGGMIVSGDAILGEVYARKLETQVQWLSDLPNQIRYLKIKTYLNKRILEEKVRAKYERRRNFSRDDFSTFNARD